VVIEGQLDKGRGGSSNRFGLERYPQDR
jgi:hypothetical protein